MIRVDNIPERQIRAVYNDTTIRVYQAYSPAIADSALAAGQFVSPPFNMQRMTWIKPSFLWMMYRCGWAMKPGQERVLCIDITRKGFEWALEHSCLSHFDPAIHDSYEEWRRQKKESPVRIQWDPERDMALNRLSYRSIQIGLSGEAVKRYVNEWTQGIKDITKAIAEGGSLRRALPDEQPYPLSRQIALAIGANQEGMFPSARLE